jgi:5-methylcytosine-specific restriction endonuclease McrA
MLVPNAAPLYIPAMGKRTEYHKEWYRKNKDHMLATGRAWAQQNREKRNATSKAWRERNREQWLECKKASHKKHAEKDRAYHARNKEHRAALIREWAKANPEKRNASYREYRKRHPEKVIESTALRRARINGGAIVKFTAAQLRARLSMYGGKCWMCGKPGKQVDHVIPLAKGGPHVLANLRPACGKCNRIKGAKRLTRRTA